MEKSAATGVATGAKRKKAPLSDRARAERNLGWKLAGPAFVVMCLVTLYPILNALYLSFFKYRLTDPAGKKFVWFQNYASALKDRCSGTPWARRSSSRSSRSSSS